VVVSAPALTLDQAVERVRAIQRTLDRGALTVPYPDHVRADLVACSAVFSAYCVSNDLARALVARLGAPDLPW